MKEAGERAVLLLLLGVERHRDHHLGLELVDDLRRHGGRQIDVGPADRDERDVDLAHALEVRRRQHVAEIPEVADDQVVEPDREERVLAARRSLLLVMEGADARYEDLLDLVLAGPGEHHGLAPDGPHAGVARVGVRDRHQVRLGLGDGVTRLGVGRVGEDYSLPASDAEAGVTQPGEIHPRATIRETPGRSAE